MIGRVLALVFALAAASCTTMPEPPVTPMAPVGPPIAEQLGALKEQLLQMVAEERGKLNAGAKPLARDARLMSVAQDHSNEMARTRSVDKDQFVVDLLLADQTFAGYVAENSALQPFTPEAGIDPESYARSILDLWLASPDHRSNIAFAAFDRTGVGAAANGDGIYVALILATSDGFGRPMP